MQTTSPTARRVAPIDATCGDPTTHPLDAAKPRPIGRGSKSAHAEARAPAGCAFARARGGGFYVVALCAALTLLAGCDGGVADEAGQPRTEGFESTEVGQIEQMLQAQASQADRVVSPGQSIQAAVDAAEPGDVIVIEPGIYAESITIDKPNIALMGRNGPNGESVVIENPAAANNGISVTPNGDGVRLFNFTTRGFERNGVFLREVDDFVMMRLSAHDNGDYGLYPVFSSGKMMHCRASGHRDAGIYVGQTSDVQIMHNYAYENVIGFEISNSSDIVVRRNVAENNTIGILGVLLPPTSFRRILTSTNVLIAHNVVRDNNHENFADPTELPAYVPAGSGILIVGLDHATVEHNSVTGNEWVGIGLGSTATFGLLAGIPIEGIEPDPEGVVIRHNEVTGNGTNPPPPPFPLPGVDLLWDGTGADNCWEKNDFDGSFPSVLPGC